MTAQQEAAVRTAIPFVTAIVVSSLLYLMFTFVPVEWIAVGMATGVVSFLAYHLYKMNLYNINAERSAKEQ